jgi:hypothetical protein
MSQQSTIVYEASVYTREVSYKNFKGETNTVRLYFALDPLELMAMIAGFNPKKSKSNNPAQRGKDVVDEGEQVKFVRDLAIKAAGTPSDDGETWEPFENFENTLAGKTFITKLASSDGDREEFAQKVLLYPFRAFVKFAEADPTNTPKDIMQFQQMVVQLERIFAGGKQENETLEQKRERLAREMAELENSVDS